MPFISHAPLPSCTSRLAETTWVFPLTGVGPPVTTFMPLHDEIWAPAIAVVWKSGDLLTQTLSSTTPAQTSSSAVIAPSPVSSPTEPLSSPLSFASGFLCGAKTAVGVLGALMMIAVAALGLVLYRSRHPRRTGAVVAAEGSGRAEQESFRDRTGCGCFRVGESWTMIMVRCGRRLCTWMLVQGVEQTGQCSISIRLFSIRKGFRGGGLCIVLWACGCEMKVVLCMVLKAISVGGSCVLVEGAV